MLDVEIEHHIISISLTPGAVYCATIANPVIRPTDCCSSIVVAE